MMIRFILLMLLSSLVFAQPPLEAQGTEDWEEVESIQTFMVRINALIDARNFTEAEILICETARMAREAGLTEEVARLNIQLAMLPENRRVYEIEQAMRRMANAPTPSWYVQRGPVDLSSF